MFVCYTDSWALFCHGCTDTVVLQGGGQSETEPEKHGEGFSCFIS